MIRRVSIEIGEGMECFYFDSLPKVIYIRLAIMIHLDGNVSSFALVSKQK